MERVIQALAEVHVEFVLIRSHDMKAGRNDPCPCGSGKKVIELLKLFENGEEYNKKNGKPYYDLSWMWERLGLERE